MLCAMKKHIVKLSLEEEKSCRSIISRGQNKAEVIRRAYVLLKSHDGKTDAAIAADLYRDDETVRRTRVRYCSLGLWAARESDTAPGHESLLEEAQIAYLTALACSAPPTGYKRWTYPLLAERMVADGIVETISASTVRRYLKKTS
jgi:putative transposase